MLLADVWTAILNGPSGPLGSHKTRHVGKGRGATEKKALDLAAALAPQKGELFFGFYAFRHGLHSEGTS